MLKIDCDSRILLGIEAIENVFSMKNLVRKATKSFSFSSFATFSINSIIESIKFLSSVTVCVPTFLRFSTLNLVLFKIRSRMFWISKFPSKNELIAFLLLMVKVSKFISIKLFRAC